MPFSLDEQFHPHFASLTTTLLLFNHQNDFRYRTDGCRTGKMRGLQDSVRYYPSEEFYKPDSGAAAVN
jgi:hypothetical protein